ncbi:MULTISPECIES: hypothetical protein [unclassified Carboxylicivirga]|uniref:hypothetical protein n=1 Tax=Carboxylicivirga TaxID=1628153 RepID=UPI003D326DEB
MNYIRHLNNTLALMDQLTVLKAYHISLYLVLFRMWNSNRFENPVSITRKETMKLARIGSPNTYVQALKDLHHHKFIRYDPSFDKTKGSLVILYSFDTISCTPSVSKVSPSINDKNNTLYEEEKYSTSIPKNDSTMKNTSHIKHHKSTQCSPGRAAQQTKGKNPPLRHIQIYFHEKGHPEAEAQRFFNYYESNGWLVGGKTPMKDWKAAARNWMLNIKKFEKQAHEARKKQFREKYGTDDAPKPDRRSGPLRPISSPPSSSNYDEPL